MENTVTTLAGEPETTELPAKLYPGRAQLSEKLGRFKEHDSELQEYRAKAAGAEADEARALASEKLSEAESADQISRAQNLRNVFLSRIANREAALSRDLAGLKEALGAGETELRDLAGRERIRREGILFERICEVIEAKGLEINAVYPILRHSILIGELMALEPPGVLFGAETPEQVVGRAEAALSKFAKLEVAKSI